MTDLLLTLPSFPTKTYTHLIHSLERTHITTSDLLTLDPLDIAKRARLPPLDVKRLVGHIVSVLQGELGLEPENDNGTGFKVPEGQKKGTLRKNGRELLERENGEEGRRISTLDEGLDEGLGGGVKRGGITEFVGERYAYFMLMAQSV